MHLDKKVKMYGGFYEDGIVDLQFISKEHEFFLTFYNTFVLIEIDEELQRNYNERFVGSVVNVLIEEIEDGRSIGHTENFLKVIVDGELESNKCYDVIIEVADVTFVSGKVI